MQYERLNNMLKVNGSIIIFFQYYNTPTAVLTRDRIMYPNNEIFHDTLILEKSMSFESSSCCVSVCHDTCQCVMTQ